VLGKLCYIFVKSETSSAKSDEKFAEDVTCKHTYAVQVKTNASTFNFWLVNAKTSQIASDNLAYVLVNLRKAGAEFFLVPSAVVASKVKESKPSKTRKSTWYSVYLNDIVDFRNNWDIFKR
jgi:hypothetical protein